MPPDLAEAVRKVCMAYDLRGRRGRLSWMLGSFNQFWKELAELGMPIDDADRQKMGDVLVAVDSKLPKYVCPCCEARNEVKRNCFCRGRGWLARCEPRQYADALVRAKRIKEGDDRPITHVVKAMIRGPRLARRKERLVDLRQFMEDVADG